MRQSSDLTTLTLNLRQCRVRLNRKQHRAGMLSLDPEDFGKTSSNKVYAIIISLI